MILQEDIDLLRNIPLFRNIDSPKLKLLAFTSERLTFHTGETLFKQGDQGDAAYIIVQGDADVIINTPGGPLTVAKIKKNDFVGEIAILCDVPRTATVKATSELVTLRIAKDVFFQLVQQFPQMSVELMRELAGRLERTNQKLQQA
ncbi:MAG: cyclic nucleotide-binding domain-containing protein, partial [Alphaproteobacteria bacterium]|nr:cyclic nucleotide-binding domain-containing protein [Alphaproteobacteria bacterium]